MALWEGLTRGLPKSSPYPPPPTPPLYTLLMQRAISLLGSAVSVGFAETRNQDRMNASRSASLRHSGPGLGLNLEPVITSRVQLLTNCYDFSRLPIYFPKFLLQFHLIVPAPYLMNDTAQVFVALILLLPSSWDFMTSLNRLYISALFEICLSFPSP